MIVAKVQYQIHLPDPNSGVDGTADLYRKPVQEVLVLYDGTQGGLSTVLSNNLTSTLQPGEIYDVLEVEQSPFADRPVFQ